MINKKTIIAALIYTLLFATGVCVAFYGTGAKYITHAYLLGVLCMLPFVFGIIWWQRQSTYGGIISGKSALKEGLKFVVFVTLLLLIFQIVFFEVSFKEYKIQYIQNVGPQALKAQIASGKIKITEAQIPAEIDRDVHEVTVFKEITAVVFKNVFYGMFASLISALLLKRNTHG
ncbi:MAG: DUF4199 domain-containing protein [Bacteroidetes bacterium]|nr:DUF4199 domain-containing protein [Bacteroidota bacterium]